MVSIKKFVDEYQLEVNGIKFWTPYPYQSLKLEQRKEFADKKPVPPPFKGRGTPSEIKEHLLKELENTDVRLNTGEGYRRFMASISLGVECTGFSYYVLDEFLKANHDTELKHHIYKSRKDLLEFYDNPKLVPLQPIKRETVESYPEWVSMAQIQKDWGNNPRYVPDSQKFTNEGSTVPAQLEKLQPGDIIGMMGHDGIGHHLVVVEASVEKVVYAHSEGRHGREDDFGGVEYGEITITDPTRPIQDQEWTDELLLETHKFSPEPLRRLKFFAHG